VRVRGGRQAAAIAIPLALGVLLAVLLIIDQTGNARTKAEARVREGVATAVTKVRTEIRNELSAAPQGDAVRTVVADHLTGAPISADTAITARDSGAPGLDDTTRLASIIVPVYRGGAIPSSTQARRAAIVSYRVVPLTLRPTLMQLHPSGGGLNVLGPDRLVTSAPKAAPSGALTYGVDMDLTGFPGWIVQAWVPSPGTPGVAWLWALAALVVAAVAAAVIATLLRRSTAAEARLRTLHRDRALVTGLAPVMQASLDLAEVAPAMSAQLCDGLELAGLSLSMPGESGEKQLFVWGTTPDVTVRPVATSAQRLASGQTLAIALTRGGRTLGVLRVVAGVPLGTDELIALHAASDLLGSSLANAEAFAHQQELVERMRSVDELKTVFLATASHELRTPVTAIVGFTTLMLDRWEQMGDTQKRGLVERVQVNGRRLDTLIEQLLDFSRLERGLLRDSDDVLDLGETVRRILADQPELAASHEVVTNLAAGCQVRGSANAVERIVTNLVGNAGKYAPDGTTITVTVLPIGDRQAVLLVDDEGSGVPVEDRERVFSRFYRGRGDTVVRTRGAGIGLAIVAEYAASMSGVATVSEAPGGGARFCVTFPTVPQFAGAAPGGADVATS
jgi:signal transduction histidine kinase